MKSSRLWICGLALCLVAPGQTVKKQEQLRKELQSGYTHWTDQDVAYIITAEERAVFTHLNNDEEREQFIEQFWLRRDPTPDTVENEFKEEHYRRIAYANERYASGIPGWKTDRGHIYIVYGPPDEIEAHPSGGTYERPPEQGGGTTSTFPFELWRYRYIEGLGNDVVIEFVDPTMTGEYRMTNDPCEKDALLYVPGAGLSLMEQMGLSSKTDRFNRTDGTHCPVAFGGTTEKMNPFNRIEQSARLFAPPSIKLKEMEAFVTSRFHNLLPMKVQVAFFPVTEASALADITVQFDNKDLEFHAQDGVQKATVDVVGYVSTMTRRRIAVFEDTVAVDSPTAMLQAIAQRRSVYNKVLPLAPGTYRLTVVAKDAVSGGANAYETAITVPKLDPGQLQVSSIVLADRIERVSTHDIGAGQFVIGNSKVRPRVDAAFDRSEKMGVYLKLYHAGTGQATYEVVKDGITVYEETEDIAPVRPGSLSEVTLEKFLDLQDLTPGAYTLRLRITDQTRAQTLTPSVAFTVK
ncbi:conserved exported hypothetical protein [Candidatus Sulfopaludibacter sp. SbA4]|nr:conserved exported hypothetical protein [Candidatus Sulfopaludibacter sp. SbA4]